MRRGDIAVEVAPQGKVLRARAGDRLQDVLFNCGVEFPCGGLGRCRGCRVRVLDGEIEVTPGMARRLSEAELAAGWRLACQARVSGPVRLETGAGDMPVLGDAAVLGGGRRAGFGIAIDLGTTTIVAELVDLASGAVLGVRSSLNPQAAHGADVMSRIQFALADGSLTPLIRRHMGRLIRPLGLHRDISEIVIVGNTAMRQIFCGRDVEPLSRAPFHVDDLGEARFHPAELGWNLAGNCTVRFLRCLGGFVGSDILVGVLACGLSGADRLSALVDLGTNGEIVVGDRKRLLCASAAAGPAFEAASIKMGMRATSGAIHHVFIEGDRLRCEVVGGGEARGICGSGVVDAVAAGLDIRAVQTNGRLSNGALVLAPPVSLEQRDIRELQLAKGAIAAGLRLLSARFGARVGELGAIYLAGAFGNYVRVPSARRIGLIESAEEAVAPVGNAALHGAKLALLGLADPDAIACEHVSLAEDRGFHDAFAGCLTFPPV